MGWRLRDKGSIVGDFIILAILLEVLTNLSFNLERVCEVIPKLRRLVMEDPNSSQRYQRDVVEICILKHGWYI